MSCSGNSSEACGGPNRLTVFYANKAPPVTDPGPPGWGSLGCYSDNVGARTLLTVMPTTGGAGALTVALCTSACHASNYIYAGVEYGGECCKPTFHSDVTFC